MVVVRGVNVFPTQIEELILRQEALAPHYQLEIARPKTLDELHDIAQFFQGREIDGKKVYGAAIFTERGSEGITMGVTNALYDWGFQYDDPKKPYHMDGFVNSPEAAKGLEFYVAFSPEREDPGNKSFSTKTIPKVVGADDDREARPPDAGYVVRILTGISDVLSTAEAARRCCVGTCRTTSTRARASGCRGPSPPSPGALGRAARHHALVEEQRLRLASGQRARARVEAYLDSLMPEPVSLAASMTYMPGVTSGCNRT